MLDGLNRYLEVSRHAAKALFGEIVWVGELTVDFFVDFGTNKCVVKGWNNAQLDALQAQAEERPALQQQLAAAQAEAAEAAAAVAAARRSRPSGDRGTARPWPRES